MRYIDQTHYEVVLIHVSITLKTLSSMTLDSFVLLIQVEGREVGTPNFIGTDSIIKSSYQIPPLLSEIWTIFEEFGWIEEAIIKERNWK